MEAGASGRAPERALNARRAARLEEHQRRAQDSDADADADACTFRLHATPALRCSVAGRVPCDILEKQ